MYFRPILPIEQVDLYDIKHTYWNEFFEVTVLLADGVRVSVDDSVVRVLENNLPVVLTDENAPAVRGVNNSKLRSLVRAYKEKHGRDVVLDGVVIGDQIGQNNDKLVGQHFFLTDIYDKSTNEWVLPINRSASYMKKSTKNRSEYRMLLDLNLSRGAYLRMVPYYYQFDPFKPLSEFSGQNSGQGDIITSLKHMAKGPSVNPQSRRSGLVFKHTTSSFAFKVATE